MLKETITIVIPAANQTQMSLGGTPGNQVASLCWMRPGAATEVLTIATFGDTVEVVLILRNGDFPFVFFNPLNTS